jgi:hypothetical protein
MVERLEGSLEHDLLHRLWLELGRELYRVPGSHDQAVLCLERAAKIFPDAVMLFLERELTSTTMHMKREKEKRQEWAKGRGWEVLPPIGVEADLISIYRLLGQAKRGTKAFQDLKLLGCVEWLLGSLPEGDGHEHLPALIANRRSLVETWLELQIENTGPIKSEEKWLQLQAQKIAKSFDAVLVPGAARYIVEMMRLDFAPGKRARMGRAGGGARAPQEVGLALATAIACQLHSFLLLPEDARSLRKELLSILEEAAHFAIQNSYEPDVLCKSTGLLEVFELLRLASLRPRSRMPPVLQLEDSEGWGLMLEVSWKSRATLRLTREQSTQLVLGLVLCGDEKRGREALAVCSINIKHMVHVLHELAGCALQGIQQPVLSAEDAKSSGVTVATNLMHAAFKIICREQCKIQDREEKIKAAKKANDSPNPQQEELELLKRLAGPDIIGFDAHRLKVHLLKGDHFHGAHLLFPHLTDIERGIMRMWVDRQAPTTSIPISSTEEFQAAISKILESFDEPLPGMTEHLLQKFHMLSKGEPADYDFDTTVIYHVILNQLNSLAKPVPDVLRAVVQYVDEFRKSIQTQKSKDNNTKDYAQMIEHDLMRVLQRFHTV